MSLQVQRIVLFYTKSEHEIQFRTDSVQQCSRRNNVGWEHRVETAMGQTTKVYHVIAFLGPVHTNPFSFENGAVLLRFQKDLRPNSSFSYRFRPSTLQHRIRFENAFILSVRMLKWTRRMRISIYRSTKLAPFLIRCCRVWLSVVAVWNSLLFSF